MQIIGLNTQPSLGPLTRISSPATSMFRAQSLALHRLMVAVFADPYAASARSDTQPFVDHVGLSRLQHRTMRIDRDDPCSEDHHNCGIDNDVHDDSCHSYQQPTCSASWDDPPASASAAFRNQHRPDETLFEQARSSWESFRQINPGRGDRELEVFIDCGICNGTYLDTTVLLIGLDASRYYTFKHCDHMMMHEALISRGYFPGSYSRPGTKDVTKAFSLQLLRLYNRLTEECAISARGFISVVCELHGLVAFEVVKHAFHSAINEYRHGNAHNVLLRDLDKQNPGISDILFRFCYACPRPYSLLKTAILQNLATCISRLMETNVSADDWVTRSWPILTRQT
ncbi:hypothetical protein BC831DRAFT_179605 [Entophlyctis helioformis]|nr:hypothetical protein BC831DRAFT_179605 [Entophlyctis helioformis]